MTGKVLKEVLGLNANDYTLFREEMVSGVYILKITTREATVGQKIILE